MDDRKLRAYENRKAIKKKRFWAKEDRDWLVFAVSGLSLMISLFSLFASALTTYFNVVKLKDDIRVVVGTEAPYLVFDEALIRFRAAGRLSSIFMNAGNRPVAILRVFDLYVTICSRIGGCRDKETNAS
jgi:hypothetical protein